MYGYYLNKLYRKLTDSLYNNGPRAKDGENYDDLINRIDNAISYLQDLPQKSIVVVTHSFFTKAFLIRLTLGDLLTPKILEANEMNVRLKNTGITTIKHFKSDDNSTTNYFKLWAINCHPHLGLE